MGWLEFFRRKPPPRIGLALSGGGARGLAHIGVLKVMEEAGIPIRALAGTSMGGVVAAAYAAGWSAEELEREAIRMSSLRELARLVDLRPLRRGLLAGEHVREFLSQLIAPDLTFENLRFPLGLKAVDLNTGAEVDLTEGSVLEAAMATSAFPGVFPPVEMGPWRLVDGGVLNNLPTDLPKTLGTDVVIGVNVSPEPGAGEHIEPAVGLNRLPVLAQDLARVVIIMTRALTKAHLLEAPPDLLLSPPIPREIGLFTGFTRAEEIIHIGEETARRQLDAIQRLAAR